MCLRDIKGYESFTKGIIYSSLYDNALINDNNIEVLVRPSDYFRIATEQEIKAQKEQVMAKCMRDARRRAIQELCELRTEPTMHNFDGFYSRIKKEDNN